MADSSRAGSARSRYRPSIQGTLALILVASTSGIAVVALLLLVGIWRAGDQLVGGIESFLRASPAQPQASVPTAVVRQMREASELTTAVFAMDAVVPAQKPRKLGPWVVARTRLLYRGSGRVRAGIDLSGMDAELVRVAQDTVRVRLPPPQILAHHIDTDRSRVHDYDHGFLALGPNAAPQLQARAQDALRQRLVATACERGILQTANRRARSSVRELLTAAGHRQVQIRLASPKQGACQAQQPAGNANAWDEG
jgi:hypothetical protein